MPRSLGLFVYGSDMNLLLFFRVEAGLAMMVITTKSRKVWMF